MREWVIRAINGIFGLEPLLDLAGLSIRKKIRVRVAILRDPSTPLGMTAAPSSVAGPLDEMQNIFWNEANVALSARRDRVHVLDDIAPPAALRVSDADAPTDRPGESEEYFSTHAKSGSTGVLGYAHPVTIFIVHEILGERGGCGLGADGSYVVLERALLNRGNRVMAHRVGHACGLPHVGERDNLMARGRHGRKLKPSQRAIFRNSPHVTHF